MQPLDFIVFLFTYSSERGKIYNRGRDPLPSWGTGVNAGGWGNVSLVETTPFAVAISLLVRHTVKFNPRPQHVLLLSSVKLSSFRDFSCKLKPASVPGSVGEVRPGEGEPVYFSVSGWFVISCTGSPVMSLAQCELMNGTLPMLFWWVTHWGIFILWTFGIWKMRNVHRCTMNSVPESCSASAPLSGCWSQFDGKAANSQGPSCPWGP